jgi:DNA-binding HxlR family transcriptional regulator
MRRASFENMQCSVAQTLEVVGDWWSLLIVRDALFGVSRFEDFQRRLGIARNTLTDRLAWLCDHDVLSRTPYQDAPVRYEYRLTPKGRDLRLVLIAMMQWGDRWTPPPGGPPLVPADRGGDPVELRLANTRTGRPVPPDRVRMIPGPGATDPTTVPPRLLSAVADPDT